MPLTVITMKSVPHSLRGDLTKWMQEIATGVYIGNFNAKVREKLWERVMDMVGNGEATLSYATRNEIGYSFQTLNTRRTVVDYEGIPLVLFSNDTEQVVEEGFSIASKMRKSRRFSAVAPIKKKSFVILDIETDGLDETKNTILEIGAIKVEGDQCKEYYRIIYYDKVLPEAIKNLTGITEDLLRNDGVELKKALGDLKRFIGNRVIIGYGIGFDIKFINHHMRKLLNDELDNEYYDLMRYVKKEKPFQKNYKLETSLKSYGIEECVPHRAMEDVRLIYQLLSKVNKFWERMK